MLGKQAFGKYIWSNSEILSRRVKLFKNVIMYFDEDKYEVEKNTKGFFFFFKFHHNK